MDYKYKYCVLKYVDSYTQESINLASILWCSEIGYVNFCYEKYSLQRLLLVFPYVDSHFLDIFLSELKGIFNNILPSSNLETDFIYIIFPKDDSALQWSQIGFGITNDIKKESSFIFNKFIARYANVSR